MADKTIKEFAEELGVSKQAIRKHFDKLPTKLTPKLINGKYVISIKAQEFIKKVSTKQVKLTLKLIVQLIVF